MIRHSVLDRIGSVWGVPVHVPRLPFCREQRDILVEDLSDPKMSERVLRRDKTMEPIPGYSATAFKNSVARACRGYTLRWMRDFPKLPRLLSGWICILVRARIPRSTDCFGRAVQHEGCDRRPPDTSLRYPREGYQPRDRACRRCSDQR